MTLNHNSRTLSAVTLGMFIISLAAGLVVYSMTDAGVSTVLWTTALAFGICLCAVSTLHSGDETGFGPSESMYRLATGAVLAAIGLVGMLHSFTDVSDLILIALFLMIIAAIGIAVALVNGKKKESK